VGDALDGGDELILGPLAADGRRGKFDALGGDDEGCAVLHAVNVVMALLLETDIENLSMAAVGIGEYDDVEILVAEGRLGVALESEIEFAGAEGLLVEEVVGIGDEAVSRVMELRGSLILSVESAAGE
jgi:hypothetical protein